MKSSFALFLAAFAVSSVAMAENVDWANLPSKSFKISTRRSDDDIQVRVEKDRTVFAVKGPLGISNADIERLGAKWPEIVMLRLHLGGLESFRASNGNVTLDASVFNQEGKPTVRLWKGGDENAGVDEKSPYWMDVRICSGDGKEASAIPVKNGYFEMVLPKAFFVGNPKAISVRWIDFYR